MATDTVTSCEECNNQYKNEDWDNFTCNKCNTTLCNNCYYRRLDCGGLERCCIEFNGTVEYCEKCKTSEENCECEEEPCDCGECGECDGKKEKCPYGKKCYKKSKQHFHKYLHDN
jgi:hypothetical protein